MTCKTIDQIISIYPSKDWFINVLKEETDELLPSDLVKTIEKVIGKVFDGDTLHECDYELNVMYELAWERINMGMYKDVATVWRRIFAMICLLMVLIHLRGSSGLGGAAMLRRALYLCDMALMMGGQLSEEFNLGSLVASGIHGLVTDGGVDTMDEAQLLDERDYDPYKAIPQPLRATVTPIERVDRPSISEFLGILRRGDPVILTSVIDEWPALSTNRWSVQFIRRVCGFRTVPVEIGSSYADADWSQKLMTINEFVDEFFRDGASKGYLAQHYLFSQISELANDIAIPDYCLINGDHDDTAVDINAWFGPSGTVSPLHQDPKHNFLCQVFGDKYVKLYPASETGYLYPNSTTMLKNTSKVDVSSPDLESFPLFAKARGYDAVLRPGEVLFIPPQCWHYVRSVSASFSVNFWWNYI